MPPQFLRRSLDALIPLAVMSLGATVGVYTFLRLLLVERKPSLACSLHSLSDENSARLMRLLGPVIVKEGIPHIPNMMQQASGVVIDVGPGIGLHVGHFGPRVTRLFFVEPNMSTHGQLEENLQKAGLRDISTIIPSGVEDIQALHSFGLSPSTADTIITASVLCSVPEPNSTCQSLYQLLKPGGQWFVYEHVVAEPQYPMSRGFQKFYQSIWPFFVGGCNLNRDTAESIKAAGSWESVDLRRKDGEIGWEMIGYIVGSCKRA